MSQLKEYTTKSLYKQEEARKNKKLRDEYNTKIQNCDYLLTTLDKSSIENKNCLKICLAYLSKKRDATLTDIQTAILMGNAVVSSASNFHLKINENQAVLTNDYGVEVYEAEGSAYASTLSFFVRIAIVENTLLQNTFILDEALATLSPESSANLSRLIKEKSATNQFILIEQKPEVFAQGVDKRYMVRKTANISEVKEEVSV